MDQEQYDDKAKRLSERLGHGRKVPLWRWCWLWLCWRWYGLRQQARHR